MKLTYELAHRMTTALLAHRGQEFTDRERETNAIASATYSAALNEVRAVAGVLPDTAGVDFVRLMETWTEEGVNLTATLLDMAISVCLKKLVGDRIEEKLGKGSWSGDAEITISSRDLREIAEAYHWERHEEAGSWTIRLQKISEMSSEAVDTQ